MSLKTFESDLISILMKDKKRFTRLSTRLRGKHFSNETIRWAFEIMQEYFSRYKKLPTLKVFREELNKSSFSAEKKKSYYHAVKKTYKRIPKISSEFIEENVSQKIEKEELLLAIDKSVREIEKGNLSSAKKELFKSILSRESEENVPVIHVLKDWKNRDLMRKELAKIPISKRFVSTPYSVINSATFGIQKSEAATIAGLTNIGKSIILGEFGVNSLLEGLNVLHFPLENTGEQTAQRYDSRITEIEYDTLKLYKFKSSEKESFTKILRILSKSLFNDIIVKEAFRKETDIAFIDGVIETLKLDGFNTELLLIDSCDIMKPLSSFKEHRLDRASVYWDLKDYCKLKRLPGLTTTQLGKGSKDRIATVEDLSEAYDKARILDIVFIASQTKEDAKNNIVQFAVDKNRDGPTGASVSLFKDSGKMRFLEIV